MEKRLLLELIGLVLLISCIFAYILFFIENVKYYTSLTIALFPLLIFVCGIAISHIKDRKRFLKESLIVLASCFNYACVFLLTVLFHLDISIFLITMTALSFLISILVLNVGRSIGYVAFSLIVGAVISILALLSPPLFYGDTWAVNFQLESVVQPVVRLTLFGIVFSFVGSILGSFVGDAF